ncbi:hypothetical protein niasHS_005453 [Heterodera schachtii]|uniref:BTB domain-containing protein n=1 Tax=Heterodera schachtii TaxID=97005 RepID=A0ABD2JIU9_HETSC
MSSSSKQGNPCERMKHLLSSGEDADIQFLVGDGDKKELLSAHKLILKHASEVFEAMFRFDSKKEKTENASAVSPVEVPDVEPAAFKIMLSFIYSEDLSELNGDNAMAVLYTAKKYGIDRLVSPVLEIPIAQLHSVFAAFVHARRFHLEDFSHQCLLYICQNAPQLFKSEEFLQIDQNLLCELFDRDQLVISSEFQIWTAALRWADEKCRQNGIECSAENRRAALGPALFKIRFPLISPAAFVKEIDPNWRSCECSATFRIVSQKNGKDDFTEKFDEKQIFSAIKCQGFHTLITFEELMDPSEGLYNKDGDKVTLAIDFTVEEKKGTKKRKLAYR